MPGIPAPNRGYAPSPQNAVGQSPPFVAGCAAAPTRNVAVNVPPKLHPLHTPEWLHVQVLSTGRYPDIERMTGRTTILALKFLVEALSNPHKPVEVRDHHPTTHCHAQLVKDIHGIAGKLGLQHVRCNPSRLTVTFSNNPLI